MKKLFLFLTLSLFLTNLSHGAPKTFGVGVLLGDPTAISGKYFMDKQRAVDLGLSFDDDTIMIFGDYLRHFPGLFKANNAFVRSLSPFVGIGPILAIDTDDDDKDHHHIFEDDDDELALGARIPFGIEWIAPEIPLGISIELVPGITVIEETDAFVQGGLAIRYYF